MNLDYLVLHVCKYTDGLHRRCDNNCFFCSENTDKYKTKGELPSIEMIRSVLENIKDKTNNIYIAGGEPTMREDLNEIVTICAEYANNVYISTHGNYKNSEEVSKNLKKSGLTNAAFSLHGCNETIHDSTTRTNGSYKNTIASIKSFIKNGLSTHINCVVTSINISSLRDMVELAANEFPNIKHLTFSHYRHHGEACEYDFLNFDPWKYKASIKDAIEASIENGIKINFRDFPLCLEPRLKLLNNKVENFYVVLWKDSGEWGLFSEEEQKSLISICNECDDDDCAGYITANIERQDKYSAWAKKI